MARPENVIALAWARPVARCSLALASRCRQPRQPTSKQMADRTQLWSEILALEVCTGEKRRLTTRPSSRLRF
jgi:hypothetical protein